MKIRIAYASETGNAECLADDASKKLQNSGFECSVVNIESLRPEDLAAMDIFLAIASTWGEGDPPTEAEEFFEDFQSAAPLNLSQLRFSVLALGDTDYEFFCEFGKNLDSELERHGANRFVNRIDCDTDYDDNFDEWIDNVIASIPQEATV